MNYNFNLSNILGRSGPKEGRKQNGHNKPLFAVIKGF
jgi:hypothetical protein